MSLTTLQQPTGRNRMMARAAGLKSDSIVKPELNFGVPMTLNTIEPAKFIEKSPYLNMSQVNNIQSTQEILAAHVDKRKLSLSGRAIWADEEPRKRS